jgi:hypothetical protein
MKLEWILRWKRLIGRRSKQMMLRYRSISGTIGYGGRSYTQRKHCMVFEKDLLAAAL